MYPNVASIKLPNSKYEETSNGNISILPDPSEIHFYTKEDGRVFIHPSSTLFSEKKYDENIMMYGSKISTSKIFIRDCTAASSVSLLLLGGDLQIIHEGLNKHTLL